MPFGIDVVTIIKDSQYDPSNRGRDTDLTRNGLRRNDTTSICVLECSTFELRAMLFH